RVEVGPDHAVPHSQWLASRVAIDALAQPMDGSGHLVPQDLRQWPAELREIELTPPLVQVRSANIGHRHFDDHGTWLRVRHRVRGDLHRLARAVKPGDPTF